MFRWVSMRAYVALILWVLYQLLTAGMQFAGLSRVSAMAHLGGALVAFFFWLWLRRPAEVTAGPQRCG
jgi:membrane associated rhomboid family serine protease